MLDRMCPRWGFNRCICCVNSLSCALKICALLCLYSLFSLTLKRCKNRLESHHSFGSLSLPSFPSSRSPLPRLHSPTPRVAPTSGRRPTSTPQKMTLSQCVQPRCVHSGGPGCCVVPGEDRLRTLGFQSYLHGSLAVCPQHSHPTLVSSCTLSGLTQRENQHLFQVYKHQLCPG